jgi:transposase
MTIPKRKHSLEFKAEAIQLAERTTVAKAAAQLSISPLQIYDWRKTMMRDFTDVERDSYLAIKNARLKHEIAEQKDELEILKKAAIGSTRQCNTLAYNLLRSLKFKHDVEAQGHTCDVKTITCSVRRQGSVAKATRRFKVTTDSDHSDPIAKNLPDRNFTATAPNQKWAPEFDS